MIPKVTIILANGQIGGVISTSDNITGVVLTGAGTGTLPLLTPVKVVSEADAATKGITEAAEAEAYKFVKEFYSIPGTIGTELYLMLVANTATLATLCDKSNASGIKKLVDFAQGKIRVLGVARTPAVGYVPTTPQFIDSDVIAAIPNAKAFAQERFDKHTPLRILIAARVHDISNATIYYPKTSTANNVGLVIGGTDNSGKISLGIVLGRVAATPPHRNIGRVKDGDLPINGWYIGNQPILPDENAPTAAWYQQLNSLIDAGYITATTYPQVGGFYLSDDPMAIAITDDYSNLAYGRVIDKASIIAYQTYIQEINDDVDLDANGNIDAVDLKALEGAINNNISLSMGESISGTPTVFIDPAQQLSATSKLVVKLRVPRKGYLREIEVELGFSPQQ